MNCFLILTTLIFNSVAGPIDSKISNNSSSEPKIVGLVIEKCIQQMRIEAEEMKDAAGRQLFEREIALALAIQASDAKAVRCCFAYNQLAIQNLFNAMKYELLKNKGVKIPGDMQKSYQEYITAKTTIEKYSETLKEEKSSGGETDVGPTGKSNEH